MIYISKIKLDIKKVIAFYMVIISFKEIYGMSYPSFECSKANTPVEKLICKTPEIAKLDSIMTLAFYSIHANKKEQVKWLKGRPNNAKLLKDYYIKRIKSFLTNSNINTVVARVFQLIDQNVQSFNSLPKSTLDESPENQQGVLMLLGIIIDCYSKSTGANAINTAYEFLIPAASACYKVWDKQYLFKWCHGRGNHNSGYYFWLLSFKNDVLTAKLLDVETFDSQTQELKSQKDITAYSAYYDEKDREMIMTINCGESDKFFGKKLFFAIDTDKLVLTKQQSTSDYQSFMKASQPGVQ